MTGTTDLAGDWSAVAAAWDRKVDDIESHTAAATQALVDGVAVRTGDRVLELAAGPGSLGATWSLLAGPTGTVVLSDIAPGMVEVARRRNAHLSNVEVAVLDASAIDRPDGSFDVVVCRMGLMFTPDPAVAFGEIERVLAPGGRFGALTWAAVEHNPWMTCVGMAAMINGLVSGGPPVGPGGIFSLGDPTDLEALAKSAGLAGVAVSELPTTFHAENHRRPHRAGQLAGRPARFSVRPSVRRTARRSAAHRRTIGSRLP